MGRLPASLIVLCVVLVGHLAQMQFLPEIGEETQPADTPINTKTLYCIVETAGGPTVPVNNARYYRDDTDIYDLPANSEVMEGSDGRVTFTITQDLEGYYTCGNSSTDYRSDNSLPLVAIPTVNTPSLYYAVPAGEVVKMECGVKQGLLRELYEPTWYRTEPFLRLPTGVGTRYQVNEEDLEDFSLTISPAMESDIGKYSCEVKIGEESDRQTLESPSITLLVYVEPAIQFLTDDIIFTDHTQPMVQFTCDATGSPNLEIIWHHNSKEIIITPENQDKYSITPQPQTVTHSVLTITNPAMIDSGTISCEVRIEYGENEFATRLQSVTMNRSLIVLDSTSLEPRPIPTLDEDLLIRIDLPPGVEIAGTIRVRMRILPNSTENEEDEEIPVDGEFSGVSSFYPFIPKSQLFDFRQFSIQIALIVNNRQGPFNPPTVGRQQFIDYDNTLEVCPVSDSESENHTLVIAISTPLAIVAIVAVICFIVALILIIWIKKRSANEAVAEGNRNREAQQEHQDCVSLERQRLEQQRESQRRCDLIATLRILRRKSGSMQRDLNSAPAHLSGLFEARLLWYDNLINDVYNEIKSPSVPAPSEGGVAGRFGSDGATEEASEEEKNKAEVQKKLQKMLEELDKKIEETSSCNGESRITEGTSCNGESTV